MDRVHEIGHWSMVDQGHKMAWLCHVSDDGADTGLPRGRFALRWRTGGAYMARPHHLGTGGGSAVSSPAEGCTTTTGEGAK